MAKTSKKAIKVAAAQELDEETQEQILAQVFPRLITDLVMLTRRPVRVVWDPDEPTASTDCRAEVRISPHFFLEGRSDIGFGTAYHEAGHINRSPYGSELLARAQKEGGDELRMLMNIVLDRKDDLWTVRDAPGFAELVRRRLFYICTMGRRHEFKERFPGITEEELKKLLRFKPRDAWEDFFFAAKWQRSPRYPEVRRAMRYLRVRRLMRAEPEELFWIVKRVRELLGKAPHGRQAATLQRFGLSFAHGGHCGKSAQPSLDPKLKRILKKIAAGYVAKLRTQALQGLVNRLKSLGIVYPGPLSTGAVSAVPVVKVPPDGEHDSIYQDIRKEIASSVDPLIQKLRRLDTPAEFTLFGQEEGELDLGETARIATGLPGIRAETVTERDIDAEIVLAIDMSGSMSGEKVTIAKRIAVAFREAVMALHPNVAGRIWAYSSKRILDFGPLSYATGFVAVEGEAANSDSHMLAVAGSELLKSRHRRKILLALCDDGPDNIEEVRRRSHELLSRGVIPVHMLIGVHGTPHIYPFEIVFTSMEECFAEFGNLLFTILQHVR